MILKLIFIRSSVWLRTFYRAISKFKPCIALKQNNNNNNNNNNSSFKLLALDAINVGQTFVDLFPIFSNTNLPEYSVQSLTQFKYMTALLDFIERYYAIQYLLHHKPQIE